MDFELNFIINNYRHTCATLLLEAYFPKDQADVLKNNELRQQIWSGLIKAAMMEKFQTSCEQHLKVVRKPDQKVIALKGFKPGALIIAPLSRNVTFMTKKDGREPSAPARSFKVKTCFEIAGGPMIA